MNETQTPEEVTTIDPDAKFDQDPIDHTVEFLKEYAVETSVRVAFLEGAVTVLTRELSARGIAPRDFEQRVIDEAEQLMDVRLDGRKGRAELVAAFLNDRTDE